MYLQSTCDNLSHTHTPILYNPVVLATINPVTNCQDAMVKVSLGTEEGIVHTTGVELPKKKQSLLKLITCIKQ